MKWNRIREKSGAVSFNPYNVPFSIFCLSINRTSFQLDQSFLVESTSRIKPTILRHACDSLAKGIILIQTIRSSSVVERKAEEENENEWEKEKRNNHLVNTTPKTSRTRLTSYKSWRDFNTRSRDAEHSQFMQIGDDSESVDALSRERGKDQGPGSSVHSAWKPSRTDDVTGVQ